jgi:hypothetical protein
MKATTKQLRKKKLAHATTPFIINAKIKGLCRIILVLLLRCLRFPLFDFDQPLYSNDESSSCVSNSAGDSI